mmetsp:Transcript_5450/g.11487  ORF Transcript_5450/g.11487 Transcript_5450/m.11487 type:complete len:380 (+) Transcript_5450:628-1767(+)
MRPFGLSVCLSSLSLETPGAAGALHGRRRERCCRSFGSPDLRVLSRSLRGAVCRVVVTGCCWWCCRPVAPRPFRLCRHRHHLRTRHGPHQAGIVVEPKQRDEGVGSGGSGGNTGPAFRPVEEGFGRYGPVQVVPKELEVPEVCQPFPHQAWGDRSREFVVPEVEAVQDRGRRQGQSGEARATGAGFVVVVVVVVVANRMRREAPGEGVGGHRQPPETPRSQEELFQGEGGRSHQAAIRQEKAFQVLQAPPGGWVLGQSPGEERIVFEREAFQFLEASQGVRDASGEEVVGEVEKAEGRGVVAGVVAGAVVCHPLAKGNGALESVRGEVEVFQDPVSKALGEWTGQEVVPEAKDPEGWKPEGEVLRQAPPETVGGQVEFH